MSSSQREERSRLEQSRPVIDAIISARDEAPTVAAVVSACLAASAVREVIVVDDGSIDDTAALATAAGAKVIPSRSDETDHGQPLPTCSGRPLRQGLHGMARRILVRSARRPQVATPGAGPWATHKADVAASCRAQRPGSKAGAMAAGAAFSDAQVFLFLDADLRGLTGAHLDHLCRPVLDGAAEMSVGWLDYHRWNPAVLRLPPSTGQRVVPRWVFDAVPPWRRSGYKMEILLNEVISEGRARTAACYLEGVTHRTKKDKLGDHEGRRQTWQMFWTLAGMPMTGEVRWRTFWLYWRGLIVLPPARPRE